MRRARAPESGGARLVAANDARIEIGADQGAVDTILADRGRIGSGRTPYAVPAGTPRRNAEGLEPRSEGLTVFFRHENPGAR